MEIADEFLSYKPDKANWIYFKNPSLLIETRIGLLTV